MSLGEKKRYGGGNYTGKSIRGQGKKAAICKPICPQEALPLVPLSCSSGLETGHTFLLFKPSSHSRLSQHPKESNIQVDVEYS